ncbi:MAG TPA: glycerophosphoryl diester phosphodiesterase membrane domain-containing protein [Steroidobacteraceae bacterium]|nr:glycerophosphoryl diester phosphodiesterase membrane domain-containing protein [Steroidobacteraceae bacterium]
MPEPTLYPPPRPLTVGEVLDLSFRIYRRTFVKCLLFGALLVVSRFLPNVYSITRGQSLAQSLLRPRLVLIVLATLLTFVFHMIIMLRQYRIISGKETGGEIPQVLRWLGRVIFIVTLLVLTGAGWALVLSPGALTSGLPRYGVIGLLLLATLYVFLRLACLFAVMVVEDTQTSRSFARSWELTRGNVLRLAAIDTVAFFLLLAVYVVVGVLTGFLYVVFVRADVALIAAAVGVMTVAAGAIATPFYSALGLAIYGDLLVRREGADLSQRISAA